MTEGNKCIPWYYPPVTSDIRICSPFEAIEFKKAIELISVNKCRVRQKSFTLCKVMICYEWHFQHCLPNCEETHYSASVSAAKFRECSSKNMGSSPMCTLPNTVTGDEPTPGHIPMWGTSVMDDYRLQLHVISYDNKKWWFQQEYFFTILYRNFDQGVPTYVSNQVTDNRRRFPYSRKVSQ